MCVCGVCVCGVWCVVCGVCVCVCVCGVWGVCVCVCVVCGLCVCVLCVCVVCVVCVDRMHCLNDQADGEPQYKMSLIFHIINDRLITLN